MKRSQGRPLSLCISSVCCSSSVRAVRPKYIRTPSLPVLQVVLVSSSQHGYTSAATAARTRDTSPFTSQVVHDLRLNHETSTVSEAWHFFRIFFKRHLTSVCNGSPETPGIASPSGTCNLAGTGLNDLVSVTGKRGEPQLAFTVRLSFNICIRGRCTL